MTVEDASKESGLAPSTIKVECRRGSFEADQPRGRRGGWQIDKDSFRCWLLRRKMRTGNAPARAKARRQLMEMGIQR
jgi:hypothetical protein